MITAAFIERFGEDHILAPIGGKGPLKHLSCAIKGHWLYCKRCEPAKIMVDTPNGEMELVRPEKSIQVCNWVEVLAKGVRVGKGYTRGERDWFRRHGEKRPPMPPVDEIEVGDRLLCPKHHPYGMVNAGFEDSDERLILDMIPVCKWIE